ncbi:MAG: threonine ammonia-lyase [Tuberibacillus sp.]
MINLNDVEIARKEIAGMAKVTPVLSSTTLSEKIGNQLFIKAEHLQTTGSFKIRGAANKVKNAVNGGARHVIGASSGNHGQAVAFVAKKLGVKATIVVPENVTSAKVDAIKGYGADIIYCGTTSHERISRAKSLAEEDGAVFIPPYDDPFIMAGQGTAGLEILEQVANVDVIYVPVGGGGLISGVLTAVKESQPDVKVIGVEPELGNDTYLSLQKGEPVTIPPTDTIADGLRTNRPGELTFPVLQKYLDDLVLVSEEEIKSAFRFVLQRMKQLIEPSGCVSIAAAIKNANRFNGKTIVALASGGNMALDQISLLL